MRYATWDLAFVAVLAFVGPSRQPSRSSRMASGTGTGRDLQVGGWWSEDGFGRFFGRFCPGKAGSIRFNGLQICHELVYVVRYVFLFWFFLETEKWSTHNRECSISCNNFSQSLKSRFSNELNFSKPPRTVPGINLIGFLAILRTWPFLWRDGDIENVSLFIGDLVTWGDEKVTTWTSWWFQPLWKILVKMGSSSPLNRGEKSKYIWVATT